MPVYNITVYRTVFGGNFQQQQDKHQESLRLLLLWGPKRNVYISFIFVVYLLIFIDGRIYCR